MSSPTSWEWALWRGSPSFLRKGLLWQKSPLSTKRALWQESPIFQEKDFVTWSWQWALWHESRIFLGGGLCDMSLPSSREIGFMTLFPPTSSELGGIMMSPHSPRRPAWWHDCPIFLGDDVCDMSCQCPEWQAWWLRSPVSLGDGHFLWVHIRRSSSQDLSGPTERSRSSVLSQEDPDAVKQANPSSRPRPHWTV